MGIDDSGDVTSLVGLAGFVVCAQVHDGEQWWLPVESTAAVLGCEACGTRAIGHGRRRVNVRDLPIVGEPVTVAWAKRIWRCPDADCAIKTWSELSEEITPRAVPLVMSTAVTVKLPSAAAAGQVRCQFHRCSSGAVVSGERTVARSATGIAATDASTGSGGFRRVHAVRRPVTVVDATTGASSGVVLGLRLEH